jgi:hypothetical protein
MTEWTQLASNLAQGGGENSTVKRDREFPHIYIYILVIRNLLVPLICAVLQLNDLSY